MSDAARRLRRVVLLDTSVASTNVGDEIIMEAVRAELAGPLAGAFVTSIASHERLGPKGRALVRQADLVIAGGTNLLSSRMWWRPVWRLAARDGFVLRNVVLMGVGWYQFQHAPDPYTRWLLRRVLHPAALHSVRDGHTGRMLAAMGITHAINTGCPTLWQLDPAACARLPTGKAEAVVATINTYMPDRDADARLFALLRAHYATIHAWVQTAEDHAYVRDLAPDAILLAPGVQAYDELLQSAASLDYVGNRLHGGIRALQHGRRAIIVEIDNRAREMGRDFHLPTVARHDFARLEAMIAGPLPIRVEPPQDAIARWKAALAAAWRT